MRKLLLLSLVAFALALASPVLAEHNNGNGNDNCEEAPCGNPNGGNGGNGGDGGNGGNGGNNAVTNTNVNTNVAVSESSSSAAASSNSTSSVGDTTSSSLAVGGSSYSEGGESYSGVEGSGNSSNTNEQYYSGSVENTNFDVDSYEGTNEQGQSQSQDQTAVGEVDSHDSVEVDASDNSVHKIETRIPASSAAPIFANACASGMSAQTMGFGGSLAATNIVCDHVALAGAYMALGNHEAASLVLARAEEDVKWRSFFAKVRGVLTLGIL